LVSANLTSLFILTLPTAEELSTAFRAFLAREKEGGKTVISKEDINAFMAQFRREQEENKTVQGF
jgi:hypothetical protein